MIQKNVRSLKTSDRTDEILMEVDGCKWDALLLSETWRPSKAEMWESTQGHIYMSAGRFENNHGVGILLRKTRRKKIQWTEYISERAIATLIEVNRQKVMLMSVYFPHTGYADHHVEKRLQIHREIHKMQKTHTNCCWRLQR